MKLSRISVNSSRPLVQHVASKPNRLATAVNNAVTNNSSSLSPSMAHKMQTNQRFNETSPTNKTLWKKRQRKISPSIDQLMNFEKNLTKKKTRRWRLTGRQAWCLFCTTLMCALILAAVVSAIVINILPHDTTTSTTVTTTTATTATTTTATTTTSTTATTTTTSTTTTTKTTTTTSTTTKTTTTTTTTTTTSTATTTTTTTTTTKTTTTTTTTTRTTTTTTTRTTTTTSTTTSPTTTPTCGGTPNTAGALFSYASGSAPTTYTLYTHTFIAPDSSSTLAFIMTGDSGPAHHYWLLDSVSVIDTTNNTNILINGNFEAGSLTGWSQWCANDANCGGTGTNYGQLTTTSCQSGTYCYVDKCNNGGHFDYLFQSFPTVAGRSYQIKFYFKVNANGGHHFAYVMLW